MSNKISRSDRHQEVKSAFAATQHRNESYHNFLNGFGSGNFEKCITAAESIEKSMSPEAMADAGAMFLELALRSDHEEDDRLVLFERARKNFETVNQAEPKTRNTQTAKALMYLASMGIYQHLFLFKEAPEVEALEESYDKQVELAIKLDKSQQYFKKKRDQYSIGAYSALKGALAESSVLLLGQRFAIEELGDASWLALPSLFSEDNSLTRGKGSHSWDISVYTVNGIEDLDPTHKVQVKAYKNKAGVPEMIYDDDIDVVTVGWDLSIHAENAEPRGQITPFTIPRECLYELYPDPDVTNFSDKALTDRLDRRTQQLLDILD